MILNSTIKTIGLLVLIMLVSQQATEPTFAMTTPCPVANFLDVQPDPANSAYPDPELTVTCAADSFTVTSNGIPNYEFIPITPGDLREQNLNYTITLTPSGAREDIPLLGDVAVLVNGLPVYGPNEGPPQGFGDPYLDGILDFCNGHVGPTGYHNHAVSDCIFANYGATADNVGLVVGYSLDGWPILAPYVCADSTCSTIDTVESSWQLTDLSQTGAWDMHSYVEGSGDLDECNGAPQPDGTYAYYATATFPYLLGCYTHGDYTPTTVTYTEFMYLPLVGETIDNTANSLIVPSMAGLSFITALSVWWSRKERN